MTRTDFNHILASVEALSPAQMRRLLRELERRMAAPAKRPATAKPEIRRDAEETAYDVARRAGLIGCIRAPPRTPTDVTTTRKKWGGLGGGPRGGGGPRPAGRHRPPPRKSPKEMRRRPEDVPPAAAHLLAGLNRSGVALTPRAGRDEGH